MFPMEKHRASRDCATQDRGVTRWRRCGLALSGPLRQEELGAFIERVVHAPRHHLAKLGRVEAESFVIHLAVHAVDHERHDPYSRSRRRSSSPCGQPIAKRRSHDRRKKSTIRRTTEMVETRVVANIASTAMCRVVMKGPSPVIPREVEASDLALTWNTRAPFVGQLSR